MDKLEKAKIFYFSKGYSALSKLSYNEVFKLLVEYDKDQCKKEDKVMKKILGKVYTDEEWDEMTDKWMVKHELEQKIENSQKEKIGKYIDSLSDDQFIESFIKFLAWEHEYEEMYYKRYIQTNSLLFELLVDVLRIKGEKVDLIDGGESFQEEEFMYKGYTFKLYVGQGSFWRIQKGEDVVFQSS